MKQNQKKKAIIKFCRKYIELQSLYEKIFEKSTNHLPFPDKIQKEIIINYTNMNLNLNKDKEIDLIHKNDKKLYELKSTTFLNGAVTISEKQAEEADYLIWMYINCLEHKIHIKYTNLNLKESRIEIKELSKKRSFKIKNFFDKFEHTEIVINMDTMNVENLNTEAYI